jgi:hypothetical protein
MNRHFFDSFFDDFFNRDPFDDPFFTQPFFGTSRRYTVCILPLFKEENFVFCLVSRKSFLQRITWKLQKCIFLWIFMFRMKEDEKTNLRRPFLRLKRSLKTFWILSQLFCHLPLKLSTTKVKTTLHHSRSSLRLMNKCVFVLFWSNFRRDTVYCTVKHNDFFQ